VETGVVTVDLDALARNYHRMHDAAAPAQCGAVVKANAYGLGVRPVATRLAREGCRRFFVATSDEGLELRAHLPDVAVYVFEGLPEGLEAEFVEARLTPVLNTLRQIERWRPCGRPAAVHIDTGMNRLGLSAADVEYLAANPQILAGFGLDCLMTHLACADRTDHELNAQQLARFNAAAAKLPAAPRSIANSAGVFLGRDYCGDLVRPGIALYGGNPFVERNTPVEPVVTVQARILQLRTVDEPAFVGYGATFGIESRARLAVLGLGYADGYPRCLGNRGLVSIEGKRAPVVGRVSMDLICVDVTGIEPDAVAVGQFVELFGSDISIDDVADAAGTISYELLTGLSRRLRREYLGVE
jgi:alanine racemase